MAVLAFYHMKGGVGKTTTAVNVAAVAAQRGEKTLLWDLDPQGAAGYLLNVSPHSEIKLKKLLKGKLKDIAKHIQSTDSEFLDLLPADLAMRHMDIALSDSKKSAEKLAKVVRELSEHYQHIIFDCPPSISSLIDTIVDIVDAVIMPLIPAPLSLLTLDHFRSHLANGKQAALQIIPFYSMVDLRKTIHQNIVEEGKTFACRTFIPYRASVEKMTLTRLPLPFSEPHSRMTEIYIALWEEIQARLATRMLL
nr:AAA family ATPase [Desulfobulbaceae bacterium]